MRLFPALWVIVVLGLFAGCAGPTNTQLAQVDGGDESGLGGTGHSDEASGLGGTGNSDDASGLGGTGIIGEITGFGSIFVNGVEVEILADTRLTRNGVPLAEYEFARGDVVVITTRERDGMSVADEVRIRNAVIGPVQKVDVAARRFQVLGQTVQLARPDMALPPVGQFVKVSGFRDATARIHATRVAPTAARLQVWLQGPVQVMDADTVTIGGQRVKVGATRALTPGAMVGVRGTLAADHLQAENLWRTPVTAFSGKVQSLRVQGYLQGSMASGYRIGDVALESVDAQTLAMAKQGKPIRLELRRAHVGHWQVMKALHSQYMPMGRPQARPMGPSERSNMPMSSPMPMRPMQRPVSPGGFMR